MERLLLEEAPTGEWGGPRPEHRRPVRPLPWTPAEQAQHYADLEAGLEGWIDTTDPRHLRAVPDQTVA